MIAPVKILSHYTVFEDKVWHLHTFEHFDNGTIIHSKYQEETADTIFIGGILFISDKLQPQQIDELNIIMKSIIPISLEKAAIKIRDYILYNNLQSHNISHLYKATIPFNTIEQIEIKYRGIN